MHPAERTLYDVFEDIDFNSSKQFIEDNFTKMTRKGVKAGGLEYSVIEYSPKSEEIKEWVKDSLFYLFGGNGNIRKGNPGSSPDTKQSYYDWWGEDHLKMNKMLEENFQYVAHRTEESLALIEGFLKSIGKDSLSHYYTTSLCGETLALAAKEWMEKGENMEKRTVAFLDHAKELHVLSQLSTYTPYISMLFLQRDIGERNDWKKEFEMAYSELRKSGRIEFKRYHIGEEEAKRKATTINLPVDRRRVLHALVYSKNYDIYEPLKIEYDDLLNLESQYPIGDNRYAFSLMRFKDKPIYSGAADIGWSIPARSKLADITDFAMVTGNELHNNGVFKFMLLQ